MSKQVTWASVRVPEIPRVRFFVRTADPNVFFKDVTNKVAKLIIEDLEDDTGYCALLRLDAEGKLVWRTKHPSLEETMWHVEFEYGLPEENWVTFAPNDAVDIEKDD
ncbi:MAG: hypothetical protein NTW87_32905 [Planctomycetota bacterium]|nr:hypothetical protein [Planctomycetota bacterium]